MFLRPRPNRLPLAIAFALGLASQSAAAQDAATDPVTLDQISVYGRVTSDTTLQIPQTVDVIDRAMIEATGSETVGDALRFVPGASRDGSTLDAFGDTYLIRGFAANQTVNGMTANALRQARDAVAIERIEVLKGPASVLYGQLQPGAVVNIVTKQPESVWGFEGAVKYARFDDWRATVDLTGPLSADGAVRFRVTGAFDDSKSFVDFWNRQHQFIAPSLAIDLGERTTVTLEAFHTRNRIEGFFNGVPAEGTVLANPNGPLPRSLSLVDPTFDPSVRSNTDVSARLEHRFSDSVRYRAAVSWTREEVDEENIFGVLGWDEPQRTLTRAVLDGQSRGEAWSAHNDLAWQTSTGAITHEFVAGGDYTRFKRHNANTTGLADSLDLYAPVYQFDRRPEVVPLPSRSSTSEEAIRTLGLFAQDRIGLTDTLRAVVGARWSTYRQDTASLTGRGGSGSFKQKQDAWTSQLGLLYTPHENLALFANRTTSFLPVSGLTASGTPLEPETGVQYEVGAKSSFWNGRLVATGALFRLEREHVAVSDRDNPSALAAIGKQRSEGVDLSARLGMQGWTVQTGYAYTRAKTVEDTNATLVGAPIRNVPRHSFVLQSDYRFSEGVLSGLRLGASSTYTGTRTGDVEGSFELPSYWRMDLSMDYEISRQLTMGMRVDNVADKRGYTHAFSTFEVWPDIPRTASFMVSYRY
ncbi:TonB-dependent siderophore receptor [Xanthomonas sp. 1678]|uniref:TonB-dependent siderophore receptor n=1 Tax=Xanthomonas sp. 1678 TaxID=3158788 RepID=UPI002864A6AF|nr:iron complex outermembrane receptor protein [Xanthomonas translucens]